MNGPSVLVVLPSGPVVFCDCVADQFEHGVLTLTHADTDAEIDVFQPGAWVKATAIDGRGDPLAHFYPTERKFA